MSSPTKKSKLKPRKQQTVVTNRESPWVAAKAEQRNARRDTILRAATRCIHQLGYTGASMEIIARELGLSYNALYHYFESKEEILAQAFIRTQELLLACVERSVSASGSGLSRLLGFVEAFQCLVQEESPPAFALVAHLPDEILQRLLAGRHEMLQGLQSIVRDGMEDGSIRQTEPSLLVGFVFGALESLPYWVYPPEVMSNSLQSFVMHAIAVDTARQ